MTKPHLWTDPDHFSAIQIEAGRVDVLLGLLCDRLFELSNDCSRREDECLALHVLAAHIGDHVQAMVARAAELRLEAASCSPLTHTAVP